MKADRKQWKENTDGVAGDNFGKVCKDRKWCDNDEK
jgi:hypothetical protein